MKTIIIGAGGVGQVVAHKVAQVSQVFSDVVLASRTVSKCDAIAAQIEEKQPGYGLKTAALDADDADQVAALIEKHGAELVINVALPYQDLSIMEGCLKAGANYVDTANYEPMDEARFSYEYQWPYHERFEKSGLTALLGSGFDPGVTNVFTAYAQKHHFDTIEYLDIIDANAGDHGQPFATNFNPEINIREVSANGRYWEGGKWIETKPMEFKETFNFPEGIGDLNMYLLYHEELESLTKNIPGLKRGRFWMTFGDNYLKHLEVLMNVGMTRIDPVDFQGQKIVPLQFLKALLPDPASLGPLTTGQTCIGCYITGKKNGQEKHYYLYNICSHEAAYKEVLSQGVSYTTGVPAMIGAKMVAEGTWRRPGVFNMEDFDPDPFMADLNKFGLPWVETFPHESFETTQKARN